MNPDKYTYLHCCALLGFLVHKFMPLIGKHVAFDSKKKSVNTGEARSAWSILLGHQSRLET